MIFILFRHGHKGLTPFTDPGLSPQGFDQSQNLVDQIENGTLPKPTHCWFSEKIRAQQTLAKVIDLYKPLSTAKIELNLRNHIETTKAFKSRIQKFCNELTLRNKQQEVHFVCTHYDWIEEFLTLINSDKDLNSFEYSNWSPGQYLVFEILSADKHEPWKVLNKGVLS